MTTLETLAELIVREIGLWYMRRRLRVWGRRVLVAGALAAVAAAALAVANRNR